MTKDIENAVDILYKGGIILYPTDTIWGLGCDATNESAVKRLFSIKHRPDTKSMIVLMENPALLERYVMEVPVIAWDLIEISTTPLTIIYPGAKNLADSLVAEDGSIGIRFTHEEFTKQLINRFRKPVVSTSANISGQPPPAIFADITEEIKNSVDYIVNYRQGDTTIAQPSAIIRLGTGGQVEIIRK